jgi:hypothetical protein
MWNWGCIELDVKSRVECGLGLYVRDLFECVFGSGIRV